MKFLEGIEPRDYQKNILDVCINHNCLVIIPTGLGKTLIALMLSIERIKKFPKKKVLFLAPTRPLGEQHLYFFKKHLPELFADIQLFTGKLKAELRKKIWDSADIIISTPQCISNDLKNKFYDLKDVSLLIEDEAHRCIKNYAYNLVAQEYLKQGNNTKILGLTASPGSESDKIKQICKNLSIEKVEVRSRDSPDVKKYTQNLEFEKIIVKLPPIFIEIRELLTDIFKDYIQELKNRKVLFSNYTKTKLISLQKKLSSLIAKNPRNFNYLMAASTCAQAIKIQHAIELLETQTLLGFHKYLKELFNQAAKKQSRGVQRLVKDKRFNIAFTKSLELSLQKKEHPKINKTIEIVIKEKEKKPGSKILIFTKFRDTAKLISDKLNKIKNIKSSIFIGQAIKGSGKEKTGLKQSEQKKIVQNFGDGKIDCLVSTNIGEEGLDIPEVGIVIFYEQIPSVIRTIQRRGRTARLKKGKMIVLITKKTRDETFYYVSKRKEKKMHEIINNIKDNLTNNNIKEKQSRLM